MLTNDDDATSSSHADHHAPNRQSRQETSKGNHLYEVLGVEKSATDDDIKRAYRKLALRYHPDKNIDGDPDKTEIFKEINHANTVLSNPQKRKIYDEYGEMGLKLLEQFGDDDTIMTLAFKPWFKWTFLVCGLLTCCCFGCFCGCMCCCQCCCNFCCGKYRPKSHDTESENVDFNDSNGNGRHASAAGNDLPNGHDGGNFTPIIQQPTFGGGNASPTMASRRQQRTPSPPHRPAVIAMPPPPSSMDNRGAAESTTLESSPVGRNYGSTVISIETNT